MKLENIDDLKSMLNSTLEAFNPESRCLPFNVKSSFEIAPREYLRFAEDELDKNTSVSLINCVAHLKRALDCQLDTYLHAFNLRELFKKRSLKIEKKLEFTGAIGYLNSRSLVRLNTIRNKMEHHYAIPDIQDIEVYFDLVTAMVHILEMGVFEPSGSEFTFHLEGTSYSRMEIDYKREEAEILIIYSGPRNSCKDLILLANAKDDIKLFAYCFRVLRVLNWLWDHEDNHEYALRWLELR